MQATQILSPSTPLSLLMRLRERGDREAWERFVNLYTPMLLHWASKQGFQDSDSSDLVQDILIKLLSKLPHYQRGAGQSFRGWLFTVTRNQARDYRRRVATRPLPTTDDFPDNGHEPLEDLHEGEYRKLLVSRALELIRGDFNETSWAAFKFLMLDGRPAKAIATELQITENAVYMARNRITCGCCSLGGIASSLQLPDLTHECLSIRGSSDSSIPSVPQCPDR